jgi:hypothetical protein
MCWPQSFWGGVLVHCGAALGSIAAFGSIPKPSTTRRPIGAEEPCPYATQHHRVKWTGKMNIVPFPPTLRTAHRLARQLRTEGFYALPPGTWNCAADLVEHLAEAAATSSQLRWLSRAHETLLSSRTGAPK